MNFFNKIIHRNKNTKPKIEHQLIWTKVGGPFHKDIEVFVDTNTEVGKFAVDGFETFLYHELMLLKKTKHVIYDIGAHLGYHTLGFLSFFSNNSTVYAFEPDPKNNIRLLQNIKRNSNLKNSIRVFDIALSDVDGQVVFEIYNNVDEGGSSESHINFTSKKPQKTSKISEEIMVKSMQLDNLVKKNDLELPSIIKMDIEGAESRALSGAKKTILKSKPIIFIEIHDILNMYNVLNFLNEIDYKHSLLNVEKDGRCFIKAYTDKSNYSMTKPITK